MTKKILVVDDEERLRVLVKSYLGQEGFEVITAGDGQEALFMARHEKPDLIILDLMMPVMDGHAFMRANAKERETPIILLTARVDESDKVVGLELGADDYLPKPFNPRELAARLRAILRRMEAPPEPGAARVTVNGVTLDPATREVFCDGQRVELTTFEFDILRALMSAAGRVLSRDDLMERLYQRKATPFDRSIDVHVSHLRRKLETNRTLIKTVRGMGYVIEEQVP